MKNIRLPIMMVVWAFCISTTAIAAEFTDINGHWAQENIAKWSDKGLIHGHDGQFGPDRTITRGEMAIILDRLFGYQLMADNTFSDLPEAWYTEAILKNNEKGILLGYDNKVRPTDEVTRQEAAVMLAKAFNLTLTDRSATFTDGGTIGPWALPYVNAMQDAGYIGGMTDGGFHPTKDITRAEVIAIVDRIVAAYYNESGTYTGDVNGLVLVNTKDVVLKGMTVTGDLIIAEGVADGDVTLDSATVKGQMHIYGGGENSVKLYNTKVGKVILAKKASKVRLYSDGNIQEIVVAQDAAVIIDGELSVDDILIQDNSTIEIRKNVKVTMVNLDAKDVKAVFDGSIGTLNMNKNRGKTEINGKGKISKVTEYESKKEKDLSSIKVDAVSGASKKEEDYASGGSVSGSTAGGSSDAGSSTSTDTSTGSSTTSANGYSLKPSFMAAPTVDVTVTYNQVTPKGYTLYVDGKPVATDSDNDGVVRTVKNHFTQGKTVEFAPKGSSTKHKLEKR